MKELIVSNLMNNVKRHIEVDETKFMEIKYGIEALYLTITKIIVICLISFFLNTLKELLLIFVFYGILRATGFGLHAKKSIDCWISSSIVFLGFPYLIKIVTIPKMFIAPALVLLTTLIILYAPADTPKRPLLNERKRKIYKLLTTTTSVIYSTIILLSNNPYIQNLLLFSIIIQVFLILPASYKLFDIEYDNYKRYKKKGGKI